MTATLTRAFKSCTYSCPTRDSVWPPSKQSINISCHFYLTVSPPPAGWEGELFKVCLDFFFFFTTKGKGHNLKKQICLSTVVTQGAQLRIKIVLVHLNRHSRVMLLIKRTIHTSNVSGEMQRRNSKTLSAAANDEASAVKRTSSKISQYTKFLVLVTVTVPLLCRSTLSKMINLNRLKIIFVIYFWILSPTFYKGFFNGPHENHKGL